MKETSQALLMVLLPRPHEVVYSDQELQWMDRKQLLCFLLDSAPSSCRVGMGCGGQVQLPGVAIGVAHGLGSGGGMVSLEEGAHAHHCQCLSKAGLCPLSSFVTIVFQ